MYVACMTHMHLTTSFHSFVIAKTLQVCVTVGTWYIHSRYHAKHLQNSDR